MHPLPRRTRWRTTSSGSEAGSQSSAMSTTRTGTSSRRASTETGRPPSSTSRTSSTAVPAGRAETSRRAIPWSPANSTTRGRSTGRTGTEDCAAASHSPRSSRRPSDPGGTTRRARCSSASRRTPPSGRSIRSVKSSRLSELIRRTVPALVEHPGAPVVPAFAASPPPRHPGRDPPREALPYVTFCSGMPEIPPCVPDRPRTSRHPRAVRPHAGSRPCPPPPPTPRSPPRTAPPACTNRAARTAPGAAPRGCAPG